MAPFLGELARIIISVVIWRENKFTVAEILANLDFAQSI